MYGYGNSMFLATHGILARTASGGGIDPDAQAFITAASITDPTQQSAINQLVVDLKGYNIWTKMQAIYPMVGGTNSQHSWNLRNTAQYQITWFGGVTSSANGIMGNGSNGYGDTGFYFDNTNKTNNHISTYLRSNSTTQACEFGAGENSGTEESFIFRLGNDFLNNQCSNTTGRLTVNSTDSRGLILNSRTSNNNWKTYRNGNVLGVNTNTQVFNATSPTSFKLSLFRRTGTNTNDQYSNKQTAFASIGDGLSDTEAANLYTAVQAFQVSLGRSIGTQTVSDADAQAFVTNAGIVDQVEANAVNNLVIGLKADSLWTKMKAVYPMVGGTSTTNSYNLKNTAQYQITWVGGVTHANTGVTFNGTNGYANTNFAPNSALTANSNHVALYSRTAAARSQTFAMDFGQGTDLNISNGIFGCSRRLLGNAIYGATNASAQGSVTAANTNGSGMFVNSITSATSRKIYRNAVTLGTLTTNISQTLSAPNMFIGADNNNGSPNLYSDYQAAFFSIGDGLDDTDATNLNSRVTTFQTALNRNV